MTPEALTRPPRARPGDLVAIVNPSLALPGDQPLAMLEATTRTLEGLGMRVRVMPHVGSRWTPPEPDTDGAARPLAGSDEERAADLNAALADPEARVVMAVWGGGGAARLARAGLIDWSALARDPKILIGFSDFSHVLLNAHARLGLVTFDGPSALQWAAAADEPMLAQARAVLTRPEPHGPLQAATIWHASQFPPNVPGAMPTRPRDEPGWRWLRPGNASGRAVVAMPSIYTTLLDLDLAPSPRGAIWCLDPYRSSATEVEGWLTALVERGALDGLAGLVVARPWPSAGAGAAMDEALLRATAHLTPAPPVLVDVDIGHTWPKWTVPNGVALSLDSERGRFSIDEAAVS